MKKLHYQNKVCFVTGAGSGIGRSLCVALANAQAKVIAADVNFEAVEQLAERIPVDPCKLDVSDFEAVRSAMERVVADYGRLDFIFNNAGINVLGEFQQLSSVDWQRIMDVNLWGVIHGSRIAYRHMMRQGSGHIVNVASGLGLTPAPRNSAYAASKFAVVGLSEALRIEAEAYGIDVSVVCPGWVQTPMLDEGTVVGDQGRASRMRIGEVAAHLPFRFATSERMAQKILAGVARRKSMIVYPAYVKYFQLLYQLCRPLSDWWSRREIRAFRCLCKRNKSASREVFQPTKVTATKEGDSAMAGMKEPVSEVAG